MVSGEEGLIRKLNIGLVLSMPSVIFCNVFQGRLTIIIVVNDQARCESPIAPWLGHISDAQKLMGSFHDIESEFFL